MAAKRFELKEMVVVIPLMTTVLALSWEIGSFIPFGGFSFFSLSEHLVAAAPALPAAIAFSALFPLILTMYGVTDFSSGPSRNLRFLLVGLSIAASIIFLSVAIFLDPQFQPWSAGVMMLIFEFAFIDSLFWRAKLASSIRAPIYATGVIVFAIAVSAEFSFRAMHEADNGANLAMVTTKEGSLRGRIVMSGQQGLLTYVPESREVRFDRSDEIKRVQWPLRTGIPLRIR